MKKFIYLLIIFILGIFITYVSYNGNKYQNIYDLVETAIEEEKYEEIAKIFGGCCDTKALALNQSDAVDLAVYNGTSISDVTYGEERSYAYEETYYIYFFNLNYDYQTYDGTDNDSALVFYSDNGKTYKYPLVVNENTNSDYLETENFTKETALLNSTRDVVSNVDSWNFMYVYVTKSMAEYISNYLDGNINGFTLIDNKGKDVLSVEANLDFSQKFFSDVNELIVNYNVWLTAYDKNENVSDAEKQFNEFYEPWLEEFNANKKTTGYSFPYDNDYLVPGKVLWKTIGHVAIYAVIMFAFYLLLFHLEQLKNLFDRIFKKKKKGEKPKTIIVKKDVVEETNADSVLEDEVVEETSELAQPAVEVEVIEEVKEDTEN